MRFEYRPAFLVALLFTAVLAASCPSVLDPNRWSPDGLSEGKIPEDLEITYETGGCFGKCPDFRLRIDSRGDVYFEGRRFTNLKGGPKKTGTISKDQLAVLLKEFDKAGYFGLEDEYSERKNCPTIITDVPWANTSITYAGRRKKIDHFTGCLTLESDKPYPPRLDEVETEIIRVSGVAKYFDPSADEFP